MKVKYNFRRKIIDKTVRRYRGKETIRNPEVIANLERGGDLANENRKVAYKNQE